MYKWVSILEMLTKLLMIIIIAIYEIFNIRINPICKTSISPHVQLKIIIKSEKTGFILPYLGVMLFLHRTRLLMWKISGGKSNF